jgi:hypothetical protein
MPIGNADPQVEMFIARHVNPAPGKNVEDRKARILFWLDQANNPAAYTTANRSIASVRRYALQNVRRLVKRHPDTAALIDAALPIEVKR